MKQNNDSAAIFFKVGEEILKTYQDESDLENMNSRLFDLIYDNLDVIKLYVDFTDYLEIKLNSRSRESRLLYQLFDKLEKVYARLELVEGE